MKRRGRGKEQKINFTEEEKESRRGAGGVHSKGEFYIGNIQKLSLAFSHCLFGC